MVWIVRDGLAVLETPQVAAFSLLPFLPFTLFPRSCGRNKALESWILSEEFFHRGNGQEHAIGYVG